MGDWDIDELNLRALHRAQVKKPSRNDKLVDIWRRRVEEFNQENKRLWRRIERLEELLRHHGVEPPGPGKPT